MVVITRGDNSLVLSAHHQGPEQRTRRRGGGNLNQGPPFWGPVWLHGGSSLVHSIVKHLDGRSVSGLSCAKSLYGSSLAQ